MNNAKQLLFAYLESIRDPRAASALFADDGVLELPYLKSLGIDARAQGPSGIERFIASLLAKVPDFAFRNVRLLIETPEQVFAEYEVEALVPSTGKIYRQLYAGRLVARDGKILLLREALDTMAAAHAFSMAQPD
ncbi:ketosteroid isomerase [Burkholderia ubonensis]|uniref:nuclear transport factor 2 family protein n=1 Tax=Burkholderia ubonensis TaxID=101571 RepID=UPI000754697F|nr:nuclear transport factor 2 family protein [Burkholderia ubonensis]KVC47821.1 ketosteroid isomerase [Burkholderia ubonensis]KVC59909.1 ketosteroid isomerase [Burkholderia ubonensis]KVD97419.1 ketosteroid isomerase [Burkholderia ubonensis]